MMIFRLAAFAALAFVWAVPQGFGADKVALVIGNAAYRSVPSLANSANDSADVAAALRTIGFDVVERTNVNREAMWKAIGEFSTKLEGSKIALFFYAGHAIQADDANYLLPINAKAEKRLDVPSQMIDLADVVSEMESEPRVSVVIVDACRNDPLSLSAFQTGQGLAPAQGGGNTLIAFSTAPAAMAEDGVGRRNSPFTTSLLKHVRTRGLEINAMMTRVHDDVVKATRGRQTPWHASALVEEVYLTSPPPAPAARKEEPTPELSAEAKRFEDAFAMRVGRRLALVIGAQTYEKLPSLAKPRNDARAIEGVLNDLGFEVRRFDDLAFEAMAEKVKSFANSLTGDDLAFFYFSGHGANIDGKDHLLPADVGADIEFGGSDGGIKKAFDVGSIVSEIQSKKPQGSIFVFDVDRTFPYFPKTRGLGDQSFKYLGSMMFFSTGKGQSAAKSLGPDDQHSNSPFVRVLVEELRKPGATMFKIAETTRRRVSELGRQVGFQQTPTFHMDVAIEGIGGLVLKN